ncbi:hypothetical protein BAUCODRAFT_28019 [Baudoinia panamericana UAMH 10762]|uniref:Uncharacterized protein n=1 Tax=Baudoinia panamericana (strain UAMH 10762) TaxID=717646 RepID=M2M563_BAUPA|nr:uncharacterized protein BAUCODRAFT_28019 [Baudoinia panamericana UAMH 10762]EMC91761.1 hypothetical protein BAUCODRAFT_28019 [Baudoinia panamericana UAMH 10762]
MASKNRVRKMLQAIADEKTIEQPFLFSDLHPQLRNNIYELIFYAGHATTPEDMEISTLLEHGPSSALTLVNRAIRAESNSHQADKGTCQKHGLEAFLESAKLVPAALSSLQEVIIRFEDICLNRYCHALHLSCDDTDSAAASRCAVIFHWAFNVERAAPMGEATSSARRGGSESPASSVAAKGCLDRLTFEANVCLRVIEGGNLGGFHVPNCIEMLMLCASKAERRWRG